MLNSFAVFLMTVLLKNERCLIITILQHYTDYSLSEALLLKSVNLKYDNRVFFELRYDDEYIELF